MNKDKDSDKGKGKDKGKDEQKKLNQEIIKNAEDMKKMVDQKTMGLPQIHADFIREFADDIIMKHSMSIQSADIFGDISLSSENSSAMSMDEVERRGKNIINTAKRSKSILDMLKAAKHRTGDDKEKPEAQVGRSAAAEHLEKMVKKLHCRHRKLIRLAEEIIARRWKLNQLNAVKDGKTLPKDGGEKMTAKEFTHKNRRDKSRRRRQRQREKRNSKQSSKKSEDMKTLYQNPMAKLKDMGKRCGSAGEWKPEDPLAKALNKVGVDKAEKCLNKSDEEEFFQSKKKLRKRETGGKTVQMQKQVGDFTDANKPTVEAHFRQSALTIFVSNFSRMTVVPKTSSMEGFTPFRESLLKMRVDRSALTNDFVDTWKRRSYAVGIILIILTALLQCTYLCAPRMGDNYVTYTMVEAISGMPWSFPTGIYALIFLGYLQGGMAVIKTAAATEHNQTVRQYFGGRKKKFYVWYGLALYYFGVWMFRTMVWHTKLEETNQELQAIFHTKFYYHQLPGRLLYTQFLCSCCGANGPEDYPDGPTIGWPKSCYTRVNKYEDYYKEPNPVEFGCSVRLYRYTAMAMAAMGFLTLLNWILILIHPIYLYVYELFICMRSKEPDPWLVEYTPD